MISAAGLAAMLAVPVLAVLALRAEAAIQGPAAVWARPGVFPRLFVVACVGAAAGAVLAGLSNRPWAEDWPAAFVLAGLGGWMAASAWVDARSAWVPDSLLVGLAFLIALYALYQGGTPFRPVWHVIGGAGGCPGGDPATVACALRMGLAGALSAGIVLAVLFAAWGAQLLVGRIVVTPPDMLAVAAPVLAFGLSIWALIAFVLLSAVLAALIAVPALRAVFDSGGAATEAAEELGFDTERWGAPVPLFAVAMPCLAAAFAAAELWPGWSLFP